MDTGQSNQKDPHLEASLKKFDECSNISTVFRTSKSAKAAEGLLPIKIDTSGAFIDTILSSSISDFKPVADIKNEGKVNIPPGRVDIIASEFQIINHDNTQGINSMNDVSAAASPMDRATLESQLEAIMKLPSPDFDSPTNMKAYYLLGINSGNAENQLTPIHKSSVPSKSQQYLNENPPLPAKLLSSASVGQDLKGFKQLGNTYIAQSSKQNITTSLKSPPNSSSSHDIKSSKPPPISTGTISDSKIPTSPFITQFWSKHPTSIDTKGTKKDSIFEDISATSSSNIDSLEDESELSSPVKKVGIHHQSNSSARISLVGQKKLTVSQIPSKDAFLLSRCIRVYDVNETGHTIDINSIMNDVKQIRDKVYQKVTNSIGAPPDGEYELYIRTKEFDSNRLIRDTSIDDLTLLEICHNPDHPYRAQLEFDKKRHPRIALTQASHKKEKPKRRKIIKKKNAQPIGSSEYGKGDSLEDEIDAEVAAEVEGELKNDSKKLNAFFGENMDVSPTRLRNRKVKAQKSITADQAPEEENEEETRQRRERSRDMSKLMDFFGENMVATVANSKLANFFGENEKTAGNRKKKKAKKERVESELSAGEYGKDSFGTNSYGSGKEHGRKSKAGSKKLEAFFGDRPPQEMIAKNLEVFFPGLNALKDNDSSFQDAVKSSAESKRTSKMQRIQSQIQERKKSKLQINLASGAGSIIEDLESSYEPSFKPEEVSSSPKVAKKRPGAINLGRGSLKINFESIDFSREATEKLIDIDNLDKQASLLRPDDLTVGKETKVNFASILPNEEMTSKVENLLNISSSTEDVSDMPYIVKTESTADFFEVFINSPDVPKSIKWIQGPLIGMGSFGKVFYGANCDTGEIMAVKQVLVKNPSLDQRVRRKMLEALHSEIALLKDLDHPNIVRYLGYYTEKDAINVFLEYVSGGSVNSALALMGPFDEILVKSLITQVLQGIDYLHDCHIIHRDIKGGNILIDDDGMAKISDFGISKKNKHYLTYDNNSVMSVQGTVYWMAPEVIKGKGYSAKVDIWSAGCVVLEMLTCKHPWQNLDEIQTLWRLGRYDKPPIPINISPEASSFLDLAFETDPKVRPTANALLHHEFCISSAEDWNFKAYKEAAILKKQQLDLADEEDCDSEECSSDDEDYSGEEIEEELLESDEVYIEDSSVDDTESLRQMIAST